MEKTSPDPKTKNANDVRLMFSSIALKYDLLNHLLSFNNDKCWRKNATAALDPESAKLYLDLCAGTGDFSSELFKKADCKVICLDFSFEMAKIAAKKLKEKDKARFVVGDALNLPFGESVFDGVVVAFGVRNYENLEEGILAVAKVLKKNAKFVILEFPHKVGGFFGPFFNFYFRFILPVIGRLISKNSFAYSYLPESTKHFPDDEELKKLFENSGFEIVSFKKRTMGVVLEVVLRKK